MRNELGDRYRITKRLDNLEEEIATEDDPIRQREIINDYILLLFARVLETKLRETMRDY